MNKKQKTNEEVQKTGNDFREAVAKHKITSFSPRACSICGTELHYLFNDNGTVEFDSNCSCVTVQVSYRPSSYERIAEFYNVTPKGRYLDRFDNHFKFKSDD